jgi:hypothetical protein
MLLGAMTMLLGAMIILLGAMIIELGARLLGLRCCVGEGFFFFFLSFSPGLGRSSTQS